MIFMFQISTSHMMIWQRNTEMMKTLPWPELWNQRWVLQFPFLLQGTLSGEATFPPSFLPPVSLPAVTKLVSLWKYGSVLHFNTLKWLTCSTDIGKIFDLVVKWGFVRSPLVCKHGLDWSIRSPPPPPPPKTSLIWFFIVSIFSECT